MICVEMTEEEFLEIQSAYQGVCASCGEIRDCTEPDAEDYECEACGENTVVGVDNALIMGIIEITE
jgi:predicted RNA-binding Zn-ribbon protein involved in translation (DUF1610 family)